MYSQAHTSRVPMFDERVAMRVAEHLASLRVQPFTVDNAMQLIEVSCGRYTRGAHKGQLRGWAEITMVERGGWKKDGPGYRNGHVERPGTLRSLRITDHFSGKTYLEG